MGKSIKITDNIAIVEICKYMSWDYFTYLKQPQIIITTIMSRMIGESNAQKYIKMKSKEYGRK